MQSCPNIQINCTHRINRLATQHLIHACNPAITCYHAACRSCNIQGAGIMVHENSQFDISGIQLRESKTQPKVSFSREIGDAQIIHTIFGRAKVRIIRKNDKLNRALLLTAAVVMTAIAAVVWQGWFASQQIEPQQNAVLSLRQAQRRMRVRQLPTLKT